MGISTQKLHARGPMGLEGLTCSKWIVFERGQIRGLKHLLIEDRRQYWASAESFSMGGASERMQPSLFWGIEIFICSQ